MRAKILTVLAFLSSVSLVFAQDSPSRDGRRFLKRIENNYANNVRLELPDGRIDGMYNVDSKKGFDKQFFGDFNAKVEFFLAPSFDGASGFRVYRDSLDKGYLLEVKRVVNWVAVNDYINKTYSTDNKVRTITQAQWDEQREQMRVQQVKMEEERHKRYEIKTKIVSVSDLFAAKLYVGTVAAIDTFKSPGKPEMICDGYTATFRAVVGHDVWTLSIHCPVGDMEKLSGLFTQIIADVEAGNFNEAKYAKLLDD